MSDSLWPHGLYSPWNSLGQNTAVGSLSLLQGNFPIHGSSPRLPHCRRVLYQQSHKGGHGYTYVPSLLKLPPISLPLLEVDTEPLFEFPETYSKFPSAIYLIYGHVSLHVTLSIQLIISSSLPMPITLWLFLHWCPANQFIISTIFLGSRCMQIPYVCVSIWYHFSDAL